MSQISTERYRRFQFGLKAVLAVTLILSLPLSWLAARLERARKQKEIVREILRVGGDVFYDWDSWRHRGQIRPAPSRLRSILGDDFFDEVTEVFVCGPAVNDDVLARVASRLDKLTDLCLFDTAITDKGLKELSELKHLEIVHFNCDSISDEGLEHVADVPSLRRLSLMECSHVSDAGMDHIAEIDKLVYLDLSGTKITDAGLEKLTGLSNLEALVLFQTLVTTDGVDRLRAALPKCDIDYCSTVPADNPFGLGLGDSGTWTRASASGSTPDIGRIDHKPN